MLHIGSFQGRLLSDFGGTIRRRAMKSSQFRAWLALLALALFMALLPKVATARDFYGYACTVIAQVTKPDGIGLTEMASRIRATAKATRSRSSKGAGHMSSRTRAFD